MERLFRTVASIALSLLLVAGFLPAAAFATEDSEINSENIEEFQNNIAEKKDDSGTNDGLSQGPFIVEDEEGLEIKQRLSESESLSGDDVLGSYVRASVPDGTYLIKMNSTYTKVLDVSGNSTASGANVALWYSTMGMNQQWKITTDVDGYVTIQNVRSGLVLDAAGGTPKAGSNVSQYIENGGKNQKWVIVEGINGGLRIVNAANPELSLDIAGCSTANGTNIDVWTSNDSVAQSFEFVPVNPSVDPCYDLNLNTNYCISPVVNKDTVLDIEKGSSKVGANVLCYKRNGGANQVFKLEFVVTQPDGKGYYRIVSAKTGMALSVENGNLVPKTNVSMDNISNDDSQLFTIEKVGENYRFVNKANGLVLGFFNGSAKSGSSLMVFKETETDDQLFVLENAENSYKNYLLSSYNLTDIADGTYIIKMHSSKMQVLDVCGNSTASGANVETWESTMGDNQRWIISHDDDGYITIKSVRSGLALDSAGATPKAGSNVSQYVDNGGLNQKWLVAENKDGSYRLLCAANLDLSLDIAKCSTSNGANVSVWTSNDSTAQAFDFISTEVTVDPCENFGLDGYYCISPSANEANVLDVAGGSSKVGANVLCYKRNGGANQIFRFEFAATQPDGKGYYRIISALTGMALDVEKGNLIPGANVSLGEITESDSQLFSIIETSDGYKFICKANGQVLDVAGASAVSGSNLQSSIDNGGLNQVFKFVEKDGLLEDGSCYVITNSSSGKAIDVANQSRNASANIDIWSPNEGLNQRWIAEKVEGKKGAYYLRSVCSGLYLTVDGGNVVQATKSETESQWMVDGYKGSLTFRNLGNNNCLDVTNSSSANGANVGTWIDNKSNAQLFKAKAVNIVADGYYIVRTQEDANQVVEVAFASNNDSANVETWTYNKGGNQKWRFVSVGNNTYQVINAKSGRRLAVSDGVASNGANVVQLGKDSSASKQWTLSLNDEGYFVLTSVLDPSYVLTVESTPSNGANVAIHSSGYGNQGFVLERTIFNPYSGEKGAMFNKAQSYTSITNYLILTDCTINRVGVFKRVDEGWDYVQYYQCTSGALSTPTVKGVFTVTGRGLHFGEDKGYTCWYYTQFFGNYLFHSVVYQKNSMTVITDGRLGINASHGCVRLDINNAKWIYDNIPDGTRVVIY